MRILLADDQPKVRFALRALLEQQPGLKVVGEAVNADDLVTQTQESCPDVLLLDWELPGLAANEFLPALLGPTRATTSPSFTSREISWSALNGP